MIKIIYVKALENYQLYVELSDGRSGKFDVKPYLNKGIFTELTDRHYFSKVRSISTGVTWPNNQDFSSDTISQALIN